MLGLGLNADTNVLVRLVREVSAGGGGDDDGGSVESPNLLTSPYITDSSEWEESSSNVTKEYGFTDQDGGTRATKITLDGVDNHHQFVALGVPLTVGDTYEIRVWVNPDTAEGYTGEFQVAYYDSSDNLTGNDYAVEQGAGWQQLVHKFPAPSAPLGDPTIRLLGWGNGSQGEAVLIGKVELVNLDGSFTAINPGSGEAVASGDEPDHTLPSVQGFNVPQPPDRGAALLWEAQPTSTSIDTVLQEDFEVDLSADGVWDTSSTEIRPASEAPFGEQFFRTHMEEGSYTDTHDMIRGTGWENRILEVESAFLRYQVRFKPGFEWVKGGKLPGLFGGDSPSGGEVADNGFSCRMMWRENGAGELYLYAMNSPDYPSKSRGRGAFYFQSDKWHTVEQEVILNDPGYDNGWCRIRIDGDPIFEQRGILYRDRDSVKVTGIMATIFFGGGNSSYAATRDEYVEHGDYQIWTSPS